MTLFDDIASGLSGLGAIPNIPDGKFKPVADFFEGAIIQLENQQNEFTGKDVKKWWTNGSATWGGLNGLGGPDNPNAPSPQLVEDAKIEAAAFYNDINTNYGPSAYKNDRVLAAIEGFTYILGVHYIGVDKKVYQITKKVDVGSDWNVLVNQANNMTDDKADTNEWLKEENTLFLKAAILYSPLYTPQIQAKVEQYIANGGFDVSKILEYESLNMLNEPPTPEAIRKMFEAGRQLMITHPALRELHQAVVKWRSNAAKFKWIDIFKPFQLGKLFFSQVYEKEGVVDFLEAAGTIAVSIAGIIVSYYIPILAPLTQIHARLTKADDLLDEGTDIPLTEINNPYPNTGPGLPPILTEPNATLSNLLGFEVTNGQAIIGGVGAVAFILLLGMGAQEKVKKLPTGTKKSQKLKTAKP